MRLQLLSRQNKGKTKQRFETKFYRGEIKIQIFFNLTFFSMAPSLSPYSYISQWNFLKNGIEFNCLVHTNAIK